MYMYYLIHVLQEAEKLREKLDIYLVLPREEKNREEVHLQMAYRIYKFSSLFLWYAYWKRNEAKLNVSNFL